MKEQLAILQDSEKGHTEALQLLQRQLTETKVQLQTSASLQLCAWTLPPGCSNQLVGSGSSSRLLLFFTTCTRKIASASVPAPAPGRATANSSIPQSHQTAATNAFIIKRAEMSLLVSSLQIHHRLRKQPPWSARARQMETIWYA